MQLEQHVAWLTNSKGKKYEDRYLLPLGALPERLEAAETDAEANAVQAKMDALTARGLVFAVLDGVGGAPLGMAAAQKTVDTLRGLYTRAEFAPRAGHPTAREILGLLYEANEAVFAWGPMDDGDDVALVDASARPRGAACLTAAYISPAGNVTLFQAGDTSAFVYRKRKGTLELFTGEADLAGRSVRSFIGLGPALRIDTFPVHGLESDDLVVLVTDGVFPKGCSGQEQVRQLLDESEGDVEAASRLLVERSRARGSVDDITALVLRVA
ncbi:MAG: hypothetical protein RL653_2449 [Pseudomonadota bacterium]